MGLFSKTCGTARALYPASCTNNTVVNVFAPAPNPNPKRFDIVHLEQIGHCVVATINYLDCTNFEGLKVCLYKDTTVQQIRSATLLDPHFSREGLAPFARFKPTEEGLSAAKLLAEMIVNSDKKQEISHD